MSLFQSADILLPNVKDMTLWPVIACDQFTSQPEYWEKTEEIVGDRPSTLRLMLPECRLPEHREDDPRPRRCISNRQNLFLPERV